VFHLKLVLPDSPHPISKKAQTLCT